MTSLPVQFQVCSGKAAPWLFMEKPGWGLVKKELPPPTIENSGGTVVWSQVGRLRPVQQWSQAACVWSILWLSWLSLRAHDHNLQAFQVSHLLNGPGDNACLEGDTSLA